MSTAVGYDLVCLGSGPAGQKAAIQAAETGHRTAVVESGQRIGGACLLSGTIPSKALREQALRYRRMQRSATSLAVELRGDAPLSALLHGVDAVIAAQDRQLHAQLRRSGVELIHGRASFLDPHRILVRKLDGASEVLETRHSLIATGSRPRHIASVAVDHEHILDSDSILSLPYIPRSLLVLGSGVIACEYASIFAALGCAVTLVDKPAEPLWFLDASLRGGFLDAFAAMGGSYRGGVEVQLARFDGFSQVEVQLAGGEVLGADIVLAAHGRIANLDGLGLERLGLEITNRGHVRVDERFATSVDGIFAAGDAVGPPALASAAADQGRRAALCALGLQAPEAFGTLPMGVYTIPEIACVGLSAAEAAARRIDVVVGRAEFCEVARAHIAGEPVGFLTLVCERASGRLLGVQIIGEGAADLVHLGQAAIAAGAAAGFFVEQTFNFPTMTEAYRIAAFDAIKQL